MPVERSCVRMFSRNETGIVCAWAMSSTLRGESRPLFASSITARTASFGHLLGLFALLSLGFTLGTSGISAIERRLLPNRTAPAPLAGGEATAVLSAEDVARAQDAAGEARSRALQTGMVIAVAIGLHNFAEGLAIGVSAKVGAISLATVLIIGFGLHNATEGFGIVGPLGGARPSWSWLACAGLIGGAPTFLGTVVGYQVASS